MEFLNHFWDAVVQINQSAADLHEGRRFPECNPEQLIDIFSRVGFSEAEAIPLEITTCFTDFDDFWMPTLGGQGPAPTYVSKLNVSERDHLREALAQRLPAKGDGSVSLTARAWEQRESCDY